MHMIVYMSDYVGSNISIAPDLETMSFQAKVKNALLNITGVLFYLDGKFLQILEGDEAALRPLMNTINDDPRHNNLEILIDTPIESRGFNDWTMDSFNLTTLKIIEKDKIRTLTKNFEQNLVPRSDVLVYYYKTLLELEKAA